MHITNYRPPDVCPNIERAFSARLNSAQGEHPPYLNLALMGMGCVASVLTLLIQHGYTQMPLIVITNQNHEKAAMELSRIFCDDNKPIKLRKEYENELYK